MSLLQLDSEPASSNLLQVVLRPFNCSSYSFRQMQGTNYQHGLLQFSYVKIPQLISS